MGMKASAAAPPSRAARDSTAGHSVATVCVRRMRGTLCGRFAGDGFAAVGIMAAAIVAAAIVSGVAGGANALDHVVVTRDGGKRPLAGRVIAEAQDGGVVLQTADGVLWPLQPEEFVDRRTDDEAFRALTREEMTNRLLADLPAGFRIHTTANYLIGYNTSLAYAQWCGALYERLHRGFQTFWNARGVDLKVPEFPLVALVFDSQESYVRGVRGELGAAATSIVGYYSPSTNRVNMYDLTGVEGLRPPGERVNSTTLINQVLQRPEAAPMVATIVHEATHQLAFNWGLQTRLADNPVWVSEGLAVYFETPDLKSAKGWSSIGSLNRNRLIQFRKYLARRGPDALEQLIRDDTRFREPATAIDAYAEAWALHYFLLRTKSKEYAAYVKRIGGKPPVIFDSPDERLAEFKAAFGNDLRKLDAEFLRYLRKLD